MIDTSVETVIPLSHAARVVNRSRPPHVATLWRWATTGVRGVILESVLLGGTRHTSKEAVQRFVVALNVGQPGAAPEPRNARAERAEAELVARGA
ncbi:MAG: DUF1580 domain-containing protein [Planctomycetes bacterium]|nr:DUF1580 domain-containing protein [Planctomycetota bacterium]